MYMRCRIVIRVKYSVFREFVFCFSQQLSNGALHCSLHCWHALHLHVTNRGRTIATLILSLRKQQHFHSRNCTLPVNRLSMTVCKLLKLNNDFTNRIFEFFISNGIRKVVLSPVCRPTAHIPPCSCYSKIVMELRIEISEGYGFPKVPHCHRVVVQTTYGNQVSSNNPNRGQRPL